MNFFNSAEDIDDWPLFFFSFRDPESLNPKSRTPINLESASSDTESSPDGWIVDTSGLKSKKIDDFRTNFEKKLDFSPDVSTYPTIGTAL